MKYKIFLLIVSIYFLSSCSNTKKKKIEETGTIRAASFNIQVIDSFNIPAFTLAISDYRKNKFLFINRSTSDIVIYDHKNKKTYIFNKFGKGEEEYPLISTLANFWNDSTIAVGTTKSINLYTINGIFIKRIPVLKRRQFTYPVRDIHNLNDTSVVYRNTSYYKMWKRISTNRYTIQNLATTDTCNFVQFPLEGTEFYKKIKREPIGALNLLTCYSKNKLYITNGTDFGIKIYDIESKTNNYLKLDLDYFKLSYRKKEISYAQRISEFYTTSNKILLNVQRDTIYILYTFPLDKDEFNKLQEQTQNFKKNPVSHRQNIALSVYSKKKKLFKDIKLTDLAQGDIVYILDLEHIIVKDTQLEDSVTHFKIYKLLTK